MSVEVVLNQQALSTAGITSQSGLATAEANAATTTQATIASSLNGTTLGATPGITLNPLTPGPNWPGNKV